MDKDELKARARALDRYADGLVDRLLAKQIASGHSWAFELAKLAIAGALALAVFG